MLHILFPLGTHPTSRKCKNQDVTKLTYSPCFPSLRHHLKHTIHFRGLPRSLWLFSGLCLRSSLLSGHSLRWGTWSVNKTWRLLETYNSKTQLQHAEMAIQLRNTYRTRWGENKLPKWIYGVYKYTLFHETQFECSKSLHIHVESLCSVFDTHVPCLEHVQHAYVFEEVIVNTLPATACPSKC